MFICGLKISKIEIVQLFQEIRFLSFFDVKTILCIKWSKCGHVVVAVYNYLIFLLVNLRRGDCAFPH
eukprot:UN24859